MSQWKGRCIRIFREWRLFRARPLTPDTDEIRTLSQRYRLLADSLLIRHGARTPRERTLVPGQREQAVGDRRRNFLAAA